MEIIKKKTIAAIAILICMANILQGCSRSEKNGRQGWPEVEDAIDSLSLVIDNKLFHRVSTQLIGEDLSQLEKAVAANGNSPELRSRLDYFKAYKSLREADYERAEELLQKGLGVIDSALQPYLYNRISHLADDENERSVGAYERILGRLKFFEKYGDNFMTAAHYTELGNLLKDVRDPEGAIKAYNKADSLYSAAGFQDNALWNRMNIASALVIMRDTAGAVAIYRKMLNDSIVNMQNSIREKIYHNIFAYTGESLALDSVLAIEGEDHPAMVKIFESQRAYKEGLNDIAVSKAEAGISQAIEEDNADALALGLYAASDAYYAMGKMAVAYESLRQAVDLTDAISLANEPDEIQMLETGRMLAVRQLEGELRQNRKILVWVCVSFGLLLILLGLIWYFTSRMMLLKEARNDSEKQRDKISRQLIATQVAMDEKDKLITDVGRQIDNMAGDGIISDSATRPIVNAIKTHNIKQSERETFMESFTNIHPDFAKRLRQMNETVTEQDIRLAALVAMGMDTKHIASSIGIRPESVKQARWRLRSKLGLEKGDSLEDTLRNLI